MRGSGDPHYSRSGDRRYSGSALQTAWRLALRSVWRPALLLCEEHLASVRVCSIVEHGALADWGFSCYGQ